ncbi:hypothetical protein B0A50_02734 [Salinomyces thailandicus]|uniref:Uncharacterized protein n=1 Tax=Salinomyces thailandicus TaxID=706561 RepID=A0A4U0U727_9PEZI|nr:hypothetical protein B0A50_02734 [Salinomyces thailandica]
MDSTIPPIVRGEFVYRDTLFVDAGGEGRRHPRASPSELKDLLNGKVPKDQVGHWYEAQLIHYGLPRSKQKDTAKVRLQQALSQGKLKVPAHLGEMEAQMKREYAGAVRKAKRASSGNGDAVASSTGGKKRKNEEVSAESAKKTKLSMNVGDISINIEHGASASGKKSTESAGKSSKAAAPAKKTSAAKKIDTTSKETAAAGLPSANASAKASSSSKKAPAKVQDAQINQSLGTSSDIKSTAGSGAKAKPDAKAKPQPKVKAEPKAKTEPKAKVESKAKAEAKAKMEPKVKAELKVKAEPPKVKREPDIKPETKLQAAAKAKKNSEVKADPDADSMDVDNFAQEMPGTRYVTGVFTLDCPQLADQLPDEADNFRLFLCVDNGSIWGGFELGQKTGVLRIDEIPIDRTGSFGWRARDSWEGGRLTFGRGCFGEIEFFGVGKVMGRFEGLFNEPMLFQGRRQPGPLWCGRSAYSFQQEWDGFVRDAYGR